MHSICHLEYSVPKNNSYSFCNGYNYDYDFIIKELAEEFKKQFACLGKQTEKYIAFTVPIEIEVTRIDKNGEEVTKNISYIFQFIHSQYLWQVHYQILPIIFLKIFIELNVNLDTMIKNVKYVE